MVWLAVHSLYKETRPQVCGLCRFRIQHTIHLIQIQERLQIPHKLPYSRLLSWYNLIQASLTSHQWVLKQPSECAARYRVRSSLEPCPISDSICRIQTQNRRAVVNPLYSLCTKLKPSCFSLELFAVIGPLAQCAVCSASLMPKLPQMLWVVMIRRLYQAIYFLFRWT